MYIHIHVYICIISAFCARIHTSEGEWKAGAYSGGALMRMLLIIQFVNSRYILIVYDEPRVTRMTRTLPLVDLYISRLREF